MMLRLLPIAALLLAGCSTRSSKPFSVLRGTTMGTTYRIVLPELPEGQSKDEIRKAIDTRLQALNAQMSTWEKDSEISRFNQLQKPDEFPVGEDFAVVMRLAKRIHQQTDRAFDPTVMPLVKLWNFGPGRSSEPDVPGKKEIEAARKEIGFEDIAIDEKTPVLRKTSFPRSVDLSAVAKGYAVDAVADLLASLGANSFLVEIGGEIRTRGKKPDGKPWRVGIQKPADGVMVGKVISLSDCAMATSGDYRNFYMRDGKRYSHTIDPRTGRPVEHQLASVSVIAKDCATADAWATAIMVLGPKHGLKLATKQNLAVLLLIRNDGRFIQQATPRWEEEIE